MKASLPFPWSTTAVWLALAMCGIMAADPAESVDGSSGGVLTILYVGETDSDAALGTRLGVEEGNLQGRFLNFSVKLVEQEDPRSVGPAEADVVIAALPAAKLTGLLRRLPTKLPVVNTIAPEERLRDPCRPNLLHTIPTGDMLANATRAWREKKDGEAGEAGEALTWHPDFKKFAARDLNKRYKAKNGKAMNSTAWAGWAASRSLADAYARGGLEKIKELAETSRGGFSFDGQKGHDSEFLSNGQLQQLLLIENNGELLGEAPGLYPAEAPACAGS